MEILHQNTTAVLILTVNCIATISYFIIYSKDSLKKAFFQLPVLLQKVYVAFFVVPLFTAPFFSNAKFVGFDPIMVACGICITILGVSIIGFSFLKIGVVPSIKSDGRLSTTGPYRIVRHPIYFGTIMAQLGLILLNQASISLAYLPLAVVFYYLMATMEEKDLVNTFGNQYLDFRSKTKGKVLPLIL